MNGAPNIGDSRVDSLGNKLGVLDNYGQDTTVTNYYESAGYEELVGYFKQWKEMGCYMADILNVTDAPIDYIPSGKAFWLLCKSFQCRDERHLVFSELRYRYRFPPDL